MVPPVEGEVDIQPANNVIDEEEGFRQQREEEAVHHGELYVDGGSSEWSEKRSSLSPGLPLERILSPRPPLAIPNSPNARAHLPASNSVHLLITCHPQQGLSYTYLRMICSSPSIEALPGAGSSPFSINPQLAVGNDYNVQGIIHRANRKSCIHRLVLPASLVMSYMARRSFARSLLVYCRQPSGPPLYAYEALVGDSRL